MEATGTVQPTAAERDRAEDLAGAHAELERSREGLISAMSLLDRSESRRSHKSTALAIDLVDDAIVGIEELQS